MRSLSECACVSVFSSAYDPACSCAWTFCPLFRILVSFGLCSLDMFWTQPLPVSVLTSHLINHSTEPALLLSPGFGSCTCSHKSWQYPPSGSSSLCSENSSECSGTSHYWLTQKDSYHSITQQLPLALHVLPNQIEVTNFCIQSDYWVCVHLPILYNAGLLLFFLNCESSRSYLVHSVWLDIFVFISYLRNKLK